jgi:carbon storage regulator CsrA
MLVLSRKADEVLRFKRGDLVIDVTIVRIKKGAISIGITAPRDVDILRGELISASDIAARPINSTAIVDLPADAVS